MPLHKNQLSINRLCWEEYYSICYISIVLGSMWYLWFLMSSVLYIYSLSVRLLSLSRCNSILSLDLELAFDTYIRIWRSYKSICEIFMSEKSHFFIFLYMYQTPYIYKNMKKLSKYMRNFHVWKISFLQYSQPSVIQNSFIRKPRCPDRISGNTYGSLTPSKYPYFHTTFPKAPKAPDNWGLYLFHSRTWLTFL